MPTLLPDSAEARAIDSTMKEWRQGDLALEERWFVHVGDPTEPLTDAAADASEGGLQALTSEVDGLAVVTQTCDIVRNCVDRPYIEVAPLVRVDQVAIVDVQRGRRPALGNLPALVDKSLVADLDRVMTVEKSIAAKWKRSPGYVQDADGRAFAQALARKRARFAFPDDFTDVVKKLQARLSDKHDRNTEEGRGLRALREIRVQAAPSWDASQVSLFFWFIRRDTETDSDGKSWAGLLKQWLGLVSVSGRFTETDGVVATLSELNGAEYVGSDTLDLGHLSARTR